MSSQDALSDRSLVSELLTARIFKRSQGRIVRQVTCLVIWSVVLIGVWRLYEGFFAETRFGIQNNPTLVNILRYGCPLALLALGGWFGFRLVNWPRFADFLIAVEAELNKVSWPERGELIRASMVVMFTIFFMAVLLFVYDLIWHLFFTYLGIS